MVITGRSDLSLNVLPVLKAALFPAALKQFLESLLLLRSYSTLSFCLLFAQRSKLDSASQRTQLSFCSTMSALNLFQLQRTKFRWEQSSAFPLLFYNS